MTTTTNPPEKTQSISSLPPFSWRSVVVEPSTHAERLDFSAVSSAALGALNSLPSRLLPSGYRSAGEWVVLRPNLSIRDVALNVAEAAQ